MILKVHFDLPEIVYWKKNQIASSTHNCENPKLSEFLLENGTFVPKCSIQNHMHPQQERTVLF